MTIAPKYVGTRIYYTADVYEPDVCKEGEQDVNECHCTNIYGEPTEHGYGEIESSGWVDPSWSPNTVYEDREDVRPDYPFGTVWDFDPEDVAAAIVHDVLSSSELLHGMYPDDYLEDHISDRIGAIDSFDGDTAYAADSIEDYYTGESARLAAHVYSPDED